MLGWQGPTAALQPGNQWEVSLCYHSKLEQGLVLPY
jgi:hypothetical protein